MTIVVSLFSWVIGGALIVYFLSPALFEWLLCLPELCAWRWLYPSTLRGCRRRVARARRRALRSPSTRRKLAYKRVSERLYPVIRHRVRRGEPDL